MEFGGSEVHTGYRFSIGLAEIQYWGIIIEFKANLLKIWFTVTMAIPANTVFSYLWEETRTKRF